MQLFEKFCFVKLVIIKDIPYDLKQHSIVQEVMAIHRQGIACLEFTCIDDEAFYCLFIYNRACQRDTPSFKDFETLFKRLRTKELFNNEFIPGSSGRV